MYFVSENTYGVINLNYNRIAILPLLGVLVLILIELICAFQLALLLKNNKYNVFLCKNLFIILNQLEGSSAAAD